MIHVVTRDNQHLYEPQLDAMFRMRHAFYIEGHRWSDLISRDGKERDEFDDDGVIYLMSIDPWGEVAAAVRLNPTTGPTLLKKFASWSNEPLPIDEDCWDISRWIAAPRHRRAANPHWPTHHQRELMLGILEFCQSRGVMRLTMLAELRLAERIAAYDWPVRYMGPPQIYEGGKGTAVAAEIRVGPDILAFTRQKTGLLGKVLFEVDPARSPMPVGETTTPARASGDLIAEIGAKPLQRLLSALSSEIAVAEIDNQARAFELLAAFNRMLEACGNDRRTKGSLGKPNRPAPRATESRSTEA
jgi:acyl-homoserine lactone synthase